MDVSDDPYEILGVSKTATDAEIRSAYRKRALRHHPDKNQDSDEQRQRATVLFAKISNAYEILSDPEERKRYDLSQQQQQQYQGFDGGFARGHDDFVSSFFGTGPGRHSHFHDPFSVFESVFREEFGHGRGGGFPGSSFHQGSGGGFFNHPDPFFNSDPMFGGGSLFGSMFGGPSGSLSRHSQRQQAPGSYRDPFQEMFQSMQTMHQQQPGGGRSNMSFTSTSTSSSTFTGPNGELITETTTTTSRAGQAPETVTERIVQKPDGTVERSVTNGNNDPQYLPSSSNGMLPPSSTEQGLNPKRQRKRSSRSSSRH